MLTVFGRKVRNYCIEKSIKQKEMANALGVSSAYLSALERGKQDIPYYFTPRIIEFLNLSQKQNEELLILAEQSRKFIKIDIRNLDEKTKFFIAIFAKFYFKLDKEEKNKIMEIILSDDQKNFQVVF